MHDVKTHEKACRRVLKKYVRINRLLGSLAHENWNDVDVVIATKQELLAMFIESQTVMKSDQSNYLLFVVAETVFTCCIRLARCLVIDDPLAQDILIKGEVYHLDAITQNENLLRNYEEMRKLMDEDT